MLCTDIARAGWTDARDESIAVKDLFDQIGSRGQGPGIVFCSPQYDLERLGALLGEAFGDRLIGCSTSGEITPAGYQKGTLTGFTLDESLAVMQAGVRREGPVDGLVPAPQAAAAGQQRFGVILSNGMATGRSQVDSLSGSEYEGIPFVGAAAGDCLEYKKSPVYYQGRFYDHASVYGIFDTSLSIHRFRTQSFAPTARQGIITQADPARNLVLEINGRCAALEYERLCCCKGLEPSAANLARHPLMARAGREHFVRSIRSITPEGGLQFFSPVRNGLVLSGARSLDLVQQTQGVLAEIHESISPDFILGFESVQRRLQLREEGLLERMGELLIENRVVGFNGYGERCDRLQLDHSLAGLAIGT